MREMQKRSSKKNARIPAIHINTSASKDTEINYFIQRFLKNSSAFSEKYALWIFALFTPYVLGFIIITVLCLSLVDISLDTYFKVLADSFSLLGLWTIGYFLLSLLIIMYGGYRYAVKR